MPARLPAGGVTRRNLARCSRQLVPRPSHRNNNACYQDAPSMRGPCDARERAPILFFARTSLATIPTSPAILQASIDPSSGCRSIASQREALLKKNGFEKLRLTACAGAMGLLAGVCGVSRSARAAAVPTGGSITLAGARWGEFRNSASTGPFATGGFAMTSGSLTGPARNDAFDGAMLCRVNGTTFANPGGTVD